MKQNHAEIVPFFILNHQINHSNLRRWVADCAGANMDGFFIHSREGLLTPYLSETWFEGVATCVDEARRCGIKAWIYDEFPYPSGVAGGKVVEADPRFAERHLRIKRYRIKGGRHERIVLGRDPVLRVFLVPVRKGKPDLRAASDVTNHVGPFNDDWLLREWDSRYYYSSKYARLYDCPRSSANHPQSVFEGDVPASEWELTVFHTRTGGDYIEPFGSYVDVSNREATNKFIELTHEEYKKRFGREFGKTIPGFFSDEPKYRNMLPWSATIAAEWTDYQKDPRALLALAEQEIDPSDLDSPEARIRMRYRETASNLFRDNWVRPIANWCAKHGLKYTGHISPEEEWVQEAGLCGSILQLLKSFHMPGCDLIIPAVGDRRHPILNFIPSLAVSAATQQGRSQALCEVFGATNYQLNMQEMKRITEWLALFGINTFTIHALFFSLDGYRKYDAPPTFYKPSTLWPHFRTWATHIKRVADRLGPQGVRAPVVIVRPMRTFWRLGIESEAPLRAMYERAMKLAAQLLERGILFQWMDDLDLADARVRGGSIQVGHARYETLVYLSDTLDADGIAAVRKLRKQGAQVLTDSQANRLKGPLHCPEGDVRAVQSKDKSWFCINLSPNRRSFTLDGKPCGLDGYESRWISPLEKEEPGETVTRKLRLSSDWNFTPASDNVVLLKRWTLNGKPTKLAPYYDVAAPGEIGATDQVALGKIPTDPQLAAEKRLVYRTKFRIEGVRDVTLVCEGDSIRGRWTATLNGKPLKHWKHTNRYDPSNLEHDLHATVRPGLNELEFVVIIDKAVDGMIDPCRLFGPFHVRNADGVPTLAKGVDAKGSGDWTKLGFPHYSGTMVHSQTVHWEKRPGERVELVLTRPPSDQLVVYLNRRRVGNLLWSPWRLDITRALRTGENRLDLHVSNTLDNFMYGRPRFSGLHGDVVLRARKM